MLGLFGGLIVLRIAKRSSLAAVPLFFRELEIRIEWDACLLECWDNPCQEIA
jgi:hypothetical protein